MTVYFIRHGATAGNLEKRYIGRTDEPLCDAGIAALRSVCAPAVSMIFTSPMRRCIKTAQIIYAGHAVTICDDLRETDFGDFEEKNYLELNGSADYQAWINSGGQADIPHGESLAHFKKRSISAFLKCVANCTGDAAFVVHGGTVMAVCEALHGGNYYDYHLPNGGILRAEWDGKRLDGLEKL